MNRGLVNLELLRKNRNKADFEGKSAYCFIYDDKLIKIYARKCDRDFEYPIDVNKVCDLSKFSADTIVFPIEYIYEDDKKVGEILPYINSKSIDVSFDGKASIQTIISGYEEVLSDLELYNNIDMIDLCCVNVLYSNKDGFHLIDTTEWQIKDNSMKMNVLRFNSSLIGVMVDNLTIPVIYNKYYSNIDKTFYKRMAKYGNAGIRLQKNMNLLMNGRYCFLDLMFAYMDVYRIHYGKDAKTLEDIKEMTKVLKKG